VDSSDITRQVSASSARTIPPSGTTVGPGSASGSGWLRASEGLECLPVAIPDFQSLLRPLLVILEDGEDHAISEVRAELARRFSLSRSREDVL
jgi:hypothetical protein